MGVRGHGRGELLVSDEEMEAASKSLPRNDGKKPLTMWTIGFYHAFCFYKV